MWKVMKSIYHIYESVGRGFESLPAYQKRVIPSGITRF